MENNKHETHVVFRVWKGSPYLNGVIALFPEIDEGGGLCGSYEHAGQHAPADYFGILKRTRPAKLTEFKSLARELEGLGYNLKIRMRR